MKTCRFQLAWKVVLVAVVAIMIACSWLTPIETAANQRIDDGMKRALITYASARAFNAVISAIKGTEVAVQPFGMGLTLTPAQALDPLDDLVEQFSQLMLVASIAFGIEKVLITISAHWLITLTMTMVAIGWGWIHLRNRPSPVWLKKVLVVLLMTRFAMPVAIIGSDILFEKFMADDYKSSQQVIELTTNKLDELNPSSAILNGNKEDPSVSKDLLDKFKKMNPFGESDQPITKAPSAEGHGMFDKFKYWSSQKFDSIKSAAEHAIERCIKLIVIFLLQTLVIPIFLLWVMWGVAKGSFAIPPQMSQLISPSREAKV